MTTTKATTPAPTTTELSAHRLIFCALLILLAGCGGSDTTGTSAGGAGGTTSQGGGGEGGATLSTTGVSSSSTTTSAPPACGEPEPAGCSYTDALKGYYPGAVQEGGFLPAPGEETDGASASCLDPLAVDTVITRAVIGFASDPPPTLAIDVWTQAGEDPGERVPAPQIATLEAIEDGPDSLTSGVYLLAAPVSGDGLVPCVGLRVVDYLPATMLPADACYHPRRSWWYGLPATGDPAAPLTWAALDCPEDDSILSYRREFPYELRP